MNTRFTPFPSLITQRLTLRQTTQADVEIMFFLRSDKVVNKFINRPASYSLQEAGEFIDKITKETEQGETITWGIALQGNPKMIGSICLWNFSSDQKVAEVGYALNPEFQNQGIMSEALQCVLDYGFNKLDLNEIEAFTHHKNENSKKLLIKNNFKLTEGKKDKDNANNVVFGIKNSRK